MTRVPLVEMKGCGESAPESKPEKTPTAAQRKVLEAMRDGARVEHWLYTLNPVGVRSQDATWTPVRLGTWKAIWAAGWASRQEITENSSPVRHYVISDAGRAAIQKAEGRS